MAILNSLASLKRSPKRAAARRTRLLFVATHRSKTSRRGKKSCFDPGRFPAFIRGPRTNSRGMRMKLTRRTFGRGLLSGIGLAALQAALPPGALAQETASRTLNFLVQPEPPTLLALTQTAGPTTRVTGKVTEGLLTYHPTTFAPIPQLAESWQVAQDGLSYTFRLREGVKWHDGKPFTSADVAFSILTLKEVHPRGRATFLHVADVETPDPLTAILRLSAPAPFLLDAFGASESPIVPKHLFEGTDIIANPHNNAVVGTGPFKFVEWVKGSHVLLERNEDYWDAGKPHLDRIVVRFIPDAGARLAAFETREIDVTGDTPVALSQFDYLKTVPHIRVEQLADQQPTVYRLEFNLKSQYYKDIRVRQAVAHALDREAIVALAFHGYGAPAYGPIGPGTKYYNPDLPKYEFDPDKSAALLDEAGFPKGADGWRFTVNHDVMPYGDPHTQIGEYIRDALARIGIRITLRPQDVPAWLKRVYTDGDYDSQSGAMGTGFDPTVGVQRLFWSKNIKPGVPFSNGSGYNNPEVDRLLEAAAIETDEAKRKQLFFEFQNIIATEIPAITLTVGQALITHDERVEGAVNDASGASGSFADLILRGA